MLLLWPLGLDLSWSKNDRVQNRFHDSSNVLQYTVVRKLTTGQKIISPKRSKINIQTVSATVCWGLWRLRLNFENSTSKFFMELWKVGFYYQKSKANLWNSSKDLIYLTVLSILLHSSKMVFKEEWKRQINKTLETFVIQRLAADFSDLPKKIWGRNLKIQPQTSFDLNNLKNGATQYFENSLKSMHFFQLKIDGRYES